ncbi:hypothetical protein JMJ35_010368 [Cladonia borealis]|uniref:Ethanolamine utilization protein n=1 Tax=Cladonia borealis TaxID=184061 RepID=A0AA39V625_9LECA|nr:hypothetical protein JMJ35_010368 [Cladonia borealis]
MGALLSSLKKTTSTSSNEKSTSSATKMGSVEPLAFQHYANAQTEFTKTLPLIANENAFLGDISTSENGPSNPTAPISAGFYRLDPGTPLVYKYTYDEMKIIVDGDFEISDESGQTVKAKKGDVFFFPKGSEITFKTEKGGLGFFCGQRAKDAA